MTINGYFAARALKYLANRDVVRQRGKRVFASVRRESFEISLEQSGVSLNGTMSFYRNTSYRREIDTTNLLVAAATPVRRSRLVREINAAENATSEIQ